jgi:hypothetical protein
MMSELIQIRITTEQTVMGDAVLAITKGLQLQGYRVLVISRNYPNRRGAGVRRYISALKEQKDQSGNG